MIRSFSFLVSFLFHFKHLSSTFSNSSSFLPICCDKINKNNKDTLSCLFKRYKPKDILLNHKYLAGSVFGGLGNQIDYS